MAKTTFFKKTLKTLARFSPRRVVFDSLSRPLLLPSSRSAVLLLRLHNFVTHTTTLSRTNLSHNNFVTHNPSHTIFHTTTLSDTIFHTQSFTQQLCQTQSLTQQLCHTHTPLSTRLCHTQLCHTQSFTQQLCPTPPHTHTHTKLCHTPSCTYGTC